MLHLMLSPYSLDFELKMEEARPVLVKSNNAKRIATPYAVASPPWSCVENGGGKTIACEQKATMQNKCYTLCSGLTPLILRLKGGGRTSACGKQQYKKECYTLCSGLTTLILSLK